VQSAAAAGARNQLRREAAWMARQPKARGTKAAARVRAFAELTSRARALPAGDTRVTFGGAGMQRQARRPPAAPRAGSLPCRARAGACRASPGEAGCAGRRCHAACLACARRERAGPHGRTARSARAAGRVAVGRQ